MMRKIVLVLGFTTFFLGGCAELQIAGQALSLAQKTAANPVTKDDLAKVELGADAVVKGLLIYRRACIQGSADAHCRANIATLQQYTRQIPPYVAQLRSFVKTNDQINAGVVYNQLTTLFTNIKSTATQLGVNIGA
jgi:hypothetical protein